MSHKNFLDHIFLNCHSELNHLTLEEYFLELHAPKLGFSAFMELLLDSTLWKNLDYPGNPYRELCIALSKEVELFYSKLLNQPAYHSIEHFIDVCFAISLLISYSPLIKNTDENSSWMTTKEESGLLLFCAISHDFGHDGTINKRPYELEQGSIDLIKIFLEQRKLPADFLVNFMDKFEYIIKSTDPKFYPFLYEKISNENVEHFSKNNFLSMLLIEADLMASILPERGVLLGQKLSDEWKDQNIEASNAVKTNAGRLGFLNYIKFLSPQASLIGLDKIKEISKIGCI